MLQNEKELIIKSQGGDKQAFATLYDYYIRTIYNFIYYKTHHQETAEDLTSETFFKALRNITSVDVNRSFVSWLYKIAHNTVIDFYRKKRPTQDIDDVWDLSDDTDIVRDVENASEFEKIKVHLKKLSSLEREIIVMRVWQDLSYKEIAEITGKSEANSKMIYSRSLKKLRDMIPLALLLLLIGKL
jgi:RNA polymerase sigma-70 factor (ECF subfamily)